MRHRIIYKEKAGVISENEVWVCNFNGYLYIADTLLELEAILKNEWESEKYLVG